MMHLARGMASGFEYGVRTAVWWLRQHAFHRPRGSAAALMDAARDIEWEVLKGHEGIGDGGAAKEEPRKRGWVSADEVALAADEFPDIVRVRGRLATLRGVNGAQLYAEYLDVEPTVGTFVARNQCEVWTGCPEPGCVSPHDSVHGGSPGTHVDANGRAWTMLDSEHGPVAVVSKATNSETKAGRLEARSGYQTVSVPYGPDDDADDVVDKLVEQLRSQTLAEAITQSRLEHSTVSAPPGAPPSWPWASWEVRAREAERANDDLRRNLVSLSRKFEEMAKSQSNRALKAELKEVREAWTAAQERFKRAEGLLATRTAERDAYKRDWQSEIDGHLELRERFGARHDETMFDFLRRMSDEAVAAKSALDHARVVSPERVAELESKLSQADLAIAGYKNQEAANQRQIAWLESQVERRERENEALVETAQGAQADLREQLTESRGLHNILRGTIENLNAALADARSALIQERGADKTYVTSADLNLDTACHTLNRLANAARLACGEMGVIEPCALWDAIYAAESLVSSLRRASEPAFMSVSDSSSFDPFSAETFRSLERDCRDEVASAEKCKSTFMRDLKGAVGMRRTAIMARIELEACRARRNKQWADAYQEVAEDLEEPGKDGVEVAP